ncbi:SLC13 family permease [uncultured Croceitalea sp.]|uniref:SLC13 family permease n=1 Tax=uncultured Croceitalea sp. TaxID=1798908 RepID=UPI003305D18C
MVIILTILILTIILFIWGKFPPDIVALISMMSLFLTGILDLTETLSGFSNPTVIMIGALFIVGEGLAQTGWTAVAGIKLIEWSKGNVSKLLIYLTLGSGFLSGFVSNTGTVATLLPVTISAAWNIGTMPSKMLIPVAFGSNTGGLLTLTGTPPNIIVSNTLYEQGFEGFSFFEFGLIGLPLLLIAMLFFRFIGYRILPGYKTKNRPVNIETEMRRWSESYNLDEDFWHFRIRPSSQLIGSKLDDWSLEDKYEISITRLKREKSGKPIFIDFPPPNTLFQPSDIITVKGDSEAVNRLMIDFDLAMQPITSMNEALANQIISQEVGMAEVMVVPKSVLVGSKIKIGDYLQKFGVQFLGVSRNNKSLKSKEIVVRAGDTFLIRGAWRNIEGLMDFHKDLVLLGSPESMVKNVPALTVKSYVALASLFLMVALMVFKLVPGAVAVLISAGVVVLSGCVPIPKLYRSVSWVSVIMIAAMIPMGLALQKTGVAQTAADGLVDYLGSIHPLMMLAGIFLLTSLFSQVINNSATAVLMAPIAILAATSLGLSPKPFMAIVAVSASTAFLTPVGTTTNAMVMTAGGYKFSDYFRVGAPLLLFFLITSLILIPMIWPF